jgi:hypothetical protein
MHWMGNNRTGAARLVIVVAALFALGAFAAGPLGVATAAGEAPPPATAAAAPSLATDKPTYAPGDTINVSGSGWSAGEAVHLHVTSQDASGWTYDKELVASVDGTVTDSFALPTGFASTFGAVATGALGETASASFSDAFAATTAPPAIISDRADYAPGSNVVLSGTGWQAGEAVHLFVNDDQGQSWSLTRDVAADGSGAFTTSFQLPNTFVATYSVTATGATSGTATTFFKDGNFTIGIASVDTLVPPTWSVSYNQYGTGSNADTTCSGAVQSTGTINNPGGNIAIGQKESAKPTTVHAATGYTFAY